MELAYALFEEYKTVRQEGLEAAGRMQSVAQYLFAAMGVVVTVAIVGAEKDRTAGAAVVMSLIPISVVVGMGMTTLELQRVLGARRYARQLEMRINAHVEHADDPGLSWERKRLTDEFRPLTPFPVVFGVAVVGIALLAPFIGGVILRDELTTLFWIGAGSDFAVGVFAILGWRRWYPRLLALEQA
jgi:hypothetical protein